ncbi:MAG: hypothetical protein ACUVSW_07075 [Roseiflexus sp.]
MSLYVPSGASPLIPGALARIERRLPHPGEVVVRVGHRVEPDDVVAWAFVPAVPKIVNLARELMIPSSRIRRSLLHEIGAQVTQGAPLARSGRFGGRVFLAPVSGVLAGADEATGYITIVPEPTRYELSATVRGVVMEVMPYEGVRIETPAAQVYGIFGIGTSQYGVLRLLVTDPAEPITEEMINPRSAYAVIIGGSGISAAALRHAVQQQVRGIIVGGIDEAELRAFLGAAGYAAWEIGPPNWQIPATPFPPSDLVVVVTEGFGNRPMSQPLFELLALHDGKEALVEGATQLWGVAQRPRVVIPLSTRTAGLSIDAPHPEVRSGALIRVLHQSVLGSIGHVRTISSTPQRLPSRVRTPTVTIALEDGSTMAVATGAVEALN